MPIKWTQFVAICRRHRLQPARNETIWTAYRPWGFGGSRLAVVKHQGHTANDFAVFRALAEIVNG